MSKPIIIILHHHRVNAITIELLLKDFPENVTEICSNDNSFKGCNGPDHS